MIFVFSASARLHARPVADCAIKTTPRLATKVKGLVTELRRLEAKDIRKQLHVNDVLAKQYHEHLGNFEKKEPVPSCALYDSSLVAASGMPHYDRDDADWANTYVRAFSGLYGLLRPYDCIQQLGLPVSLSTKLANSKGKFLHNYWREPIALELERALKTCPMPTIVNLAKQEDSDVIDLSLLPENTRIVRVDFASSGRGKGKGDVSESRGEFLRWALENRCMSIDDLLEYRGLVGEGDPATHRVSLKNKDSNVIKFEEATQDGGSDNWRKKLGESGKSKGAFMKDVAGSKKTKYMTTEIKKALIKDRKKSRKNSEVY